MSAVSLERPFDACSYVGLQAAVPPACQEISSFRQIFTYHETAEAFKGFLDNVFMQLDKEKFYTLINDILKDESLSDEQIYQQLYDRIAEARPGALKRIYWQLKSLANLRDVMRGQALAVVEQLQSIFPNKVNINGAMEIGYPGRHLRGAKKIFNITGPVYTMVEKETSLDFFQRGFFRPYDRLVKLEDYREIDNTIVQDQSLDLVYCFTGLHHGDPNFSKAFAQALKSKIRPGGFFVLRDHDCKTEALRHMAIVVHRVFNAATGVTPEENSKEIHNFQPMEHWEKLMTENGFRRVPGKGLVQDGDPSMNTMVAFERITETSDDELVAARRVAHNNPEYFRPLAQSALSATEWHIVDVAEEHSKFMQRCCTGEATFDQFPFWKQMKVLWKLFGDSCRAVRQKEGTRALLGNIDTYLNASFVLMLSVDMLFKAIVFAPVSLFASKEARKNATTVGVLANYTKKYSKFLEKQYFHEYDYFNEAGLLWKATKKGFGEPNSSLGKNLLNIYLATTLSIGLVVKGVFCKLTNLGYGSVEKPTIDMIVRGDVLHSGIKEKAVFGQTHVISFPRYKDGMDFLLKFENSSAEIAEIAGQTRIYIKTLVSTTNTEIDTTEAYKPVFEKPILTDEEHKYVTFEVDVTKLRTALKDFRLKGIKVEYIHDY